MSDSYYQFKKEDAYEFRRSVDIPAYERGDELTFKACPYCHGGTNKDKDTFSVNLRTGQFECKRSSCGVKGNIITLAKDFRDKGFDLGRDFNAYYNIGGAKDKYVRFQNNKKKIEVRDPAVAYMVSRGITEEITRKYEITTMPDNENVLVFPFKNEDGELDFVKYRKINYEKGKGSKEWCVTGNYRKILFGMNHCEDFGTLVITEGQIDSLSLATAGIKNAVSVPTGKNGFTWFPNVWNWLIKFDEIVVFGDREGDGITLSHEIASRFPKTVRTVRIEDYGTHKDANEILNDPEMGSEALRKAVENSKAIVSLRIKSLSEVESIDLEKLDHFPIGMKSIDEAIGGGFHYGEVNILTGKCGDGKSTFASQIVARMIQNGLKCFCYSGELPNYQFKAWIDRQISGMKTLPQGVQNAVNDWYRERCYIYDNSALIDDNEELFGVMEQAVKGLGCRFFLIDNLMTAMEDKEDRDLFRQQSAFLNRLTKFAKGFEIIVLLVAHPRKGDSIENDSISGSGDITNRANIVLRFQRKPDRDCVRHDNTESYIYITKNRTTGKLNKKGIDVSYNGESMRITEDGQEDRDFMGDGFRNASKEETEVFEQGVIEF